MVQLALVVLRRKRNPTQTAGILCLYLKETHRTPLRQNDVYSDNSSNVDNILNIVYQYNSTARYQHVPSDAQYMMQVGRLDQTTTSAVAIGVCSTHLSIAAFFRRYCIRRLARQQNILNRCYTARSLRPTSTTWKSHRSGRRRRSCFNRSSVSFRFRSLQQRCNERRDANTRRIICETLRSCSKLYRRVITDVYGKSGIAMEQE